MKVLLQIIGWLVGTLLILQFIRIDVPPAPKVNADDEIKAPKEIIKILKVACYDCHSNRDSMPWYGKIVPINWQVASNIKNARNWLNFSKWNQYTKEKKQKLYQGIVDSLRFKMPPAEYLLFHKEARLTPEERKMLQDWATKNIKED